MDPQELRMILTAVREKFIEVRLLLDAPVKDSQKEPYKTKYVAIDILKEIKLDLLSVINKTTDENEAVVMMLAIIHVNLGLLYEDTEELKAGEEEFMRCIHLIKDKKSEPKAIVPYLSALNHLGIIWSQFNQQTKAKAFLERAEQVYKEFISADHKCEPINMTVTFGIEATKDDLNPKDVLEGIHTLTLYYLAQVYGFLKDHHKSALYFHMTLQRQLEDKKVIVTATFDYIDWALNAATLSQYFMENEGFSQARHHLAAASYILHKYEDILKAADTDPENEAISAEWENFRHRSADVARCWAKYGLMLLSTSKERLLKQIENEDQDNHELKDEKNTKKMLVGMKFERLKDEIDLYANQITDKYLLDFNDARPVFAHTIKWLEEAKQYYTLENHASDYVEIAQDISQAYKYLIFFEDNEDYQAKMHKRRIDTLESVLKELNPQYYKNACRQIWIELGETYSDILDIKVDKLRASDDKPMPHALTKINHLAKSAIKNIQTFLNSLENNASDANAAKFADDMVHPALCAHFHLGRLYNKIITPDKSVQLDNTINSINAYKFVVDYCKKDAKAAETMKTELNLCKELLSLLPLKVVKLRQEMMMK